jgi:hypothetical protein
MSSARRLLLLAVAIALGITVVLGEQFVFAAALGRSIDLGETDVLFMNAVLVAIPFLLLAARSTARLLPWLVILFLTLALHWWWLAKGIAYQRSPDGSGVDMLGALIMLFSPLPLAGLAMMLDLPLKRRR